MMPKRLINPWFHIDTNRINSREGLCSMNQLEKWHRDGVIRLSMCSTAQAEASAGHDRRRSQKALELRLATAIPNN